jgi:hypothetical protein
MPTQFSIRILPSERPSDAPSLGIAFALPGSNLASGRRSVPQSATETLAGQDTNLDFRHVQSTRMLGRVVEHDASPLLSKRLIVLLRTAGNAPRSAF